MILIRSKAEGRDDEQPLMHHWPMSRDIVVPRVKDGILQYTMMELVAPTVPGERLWTLRDKVVQQPPPGPPVTSAMPRATSTTAGNFDIPRTTGEPF